MDVDGKQGGKVSGLRAFVFCFVGVLMCAIYLRTDDDQVGILMHNIHTKSTGMYIKAKKKFTIM